MHLLAVKRLLKVNSVISILQIGKHRVRKIKDTMQLIRTRASIWTQVFRLCSWGSLQIRSHFFQKLGPLTLNSKPWEWMIGPLRLNANTVLWEWGLRVSRAECRARKRKGGGRGGYLSGNVAQNHSGCTEWAFLCLRRADTWDDSTSCPHTASFLVAAIADWSHQWMMQPVQMDRITHCWITQPWRTPLPSA